MPEIYPDDTTLMAQSADVATGVEYIPIGTSPYFLEHRRMMHRLLRAAERANDLRVYDAGGLMIGVRGGRCFVGDQPREIVAVDTIELSAQTTSHVYIDLTGQVQISISGLPADRSTFIALAEVLTGSDAVASITDLRGESFLQAQSAALAGITASTDEINTALDGVSQNVTAANFSTLTDGSASNASNLHHHLETSLQVDGEAAVTISNTSSHANATVVLDFNLPAVLPDATHLLVNRATGFLTQRHLGETYTLLGSSAMSWAYPGPLNANVPETLLGAIPISGEVSAVILSAGGNIESSDNADQYTCTVRINGAVVTIISPSLTAADGSGFVSTDQGQGTAGVIDITGVQNVSRGDVVTIQVTRTINGVVTVQPSDLAVLVVIRAGRPE